MDELGGKGNLDNKRNEVKPKAHAAVRNDIEKATGVKPTMVPVRPLPNEADPQ